MACPFGATADYHDRKGLRLHPRIAVFSFSGALLTTAAVTSSRRTRESNRDYFAGMTNRREQKPDRWSGQEVERAAAGEAERGADRVEANTSARAPDEQAEPLDNEPEGARRRDPSGESSEDKVADAAETHRQDAPAKHGPGHGKL
jgi:hypothetical protein